MTILRVWSVLAVSILLGCSGGEEGAGGATGSSSNGAGDAGADAGEGGGGADAGSGTAGSGTAGSGTAGSDAGTPSLTEDCPTREAIEVMEGCGDGAWRCAYAAEPCPETFHCETIEVNEPFFASGGAPPPGTPCTVVGAECTYLENVDYCTERTGLWVCDADGVLAFAETLLETDYCEE